MALLVKFYNNEKDEADEALAKCNFWSDIADDLDLVTQLIPASQFVLVGTSLTC